MIQQHDHGLNWVPTAESDGSMPDVKRFIQLFFANAEKNGILAACLSICRISTCAYEYE
jgi:hypothetical protein